MDKIKGTQSSNKKALLISASDLTFVKLISKTYLSSSFFNLINQISPVTDFSLQKERWREYDASENPFKEIQKFCLQESGATLEMVRAYRPGHSNLSEELMCFIKCTFVKHEIIKADGEIVLDEIKRSHILEDYPEPSKNAVYQCVEKLPKIEKCSDVLALEKCFVENTS